MAKPRFFLTPKEILSPTGRMSRMQYFIHGLLVLVLVFIGAMAIGVVGIADAEISTLVWILAYTLFMLALLYLLVCLYAKRLHDLSWSAWWCLLALFDIPVDLGIMIADMYLNPPEIVANINTIIGIVGNITGLGLGLVLTFKAGNRGPNKYGPDPLRPPQPDATVF